MLQKSWYVMQEKIDIKDTRYLMQLRPLGDIFHRNDLLVSLIYDCVTEAFWVFFYFSFLSYFEKEIAL